MDEFTEVDNSDVFKLKIQPNRPLEFYPETVLSFSFEMDSDLLVVQRNIYTMLDLLSDTGGFMSIFFSSLSLLIALWNFNNYEYHFLTNFFKKKTFKTIENNKVHASDCIIVNFEPRNICNIQEYLLTLMPCLR